MIWRWQWRYAWRTLRRRCLGCGSKEHVICFRHEHEPPERSTP